jgi:hypothetical protein
VSEFLISSFGHYKISVGLSIEWAADQAEQHVKQK